MLNQYLTDTYQSFPWLPYLTDPLTDTNRVFNPNQYLPFFNSYPDQYLNDSYRLVIVKTSLASMENKGIEIHNRYWVLLKFWAQTRKLQDKQDSKIDSSNGSWYFNET